MTPWEDIGKPDTHSGFAVRLADMDHPFDFYWGRDIDGRYVFRFMGTFDPEVVEDAPRMKGISVRHGKETDRSHLTLVLESSEDASIFQYLCTSLLDTTRALKRGNDEDAARVVLTHLSRWQKLLKGRKEFLSLNEQLGLFGELAVLRDIFLENLEPRDAIACWTGPLEDEQDFGYGDSLVEVKTSRSTKDAKVRIASMEQLDPVSGVLSLVFQTVGVFRDSPPESLSLNAIVSNISDTLVPAGVEVMDQFGMRLALAGYVADPEYDKYKFALVKRHIYAVEDGFPRLDTAMIPSGIEKVAYTLSVDACSEFELDADTALERLMGKAAKGSVMAVAVPPGLLVNLPESGELEFKSTLRYCFRNSKPEKYIESAIVKSVAGFANSRGGQLVIGVSDDSNVIGLGNDYSTLKQQNRDGFELHLTNLLVSAFDETFVSQSVSMDFHEIDGNDICVVKVEPSRKLRFVDYKKNGEAEKLFVRMGNSTRTIPPKQIPDFIKGR